MISYRDIFKKIIKKDIQESIVYVEDRDDITDEIEKSLLEIKEVYDFPTEEIEMAIASRKKSRR